METPKRFEVFLALASVISSMLLRLRDAAHDEKDRPAIGFFSAAQWAILHSKFPRLVKRQPTMQQALRATAQMGGFLGRKGDGDPGWITFKHPDIGGRGFVRFWGSGGVLSHSEMHP